MADAGPYTGAAPGVIVPRLARDLPGTRAKTPAYAPSRPWRCPTGHSRKPKSAGRALHVRLYLENLIRALLIFHELWNRHGQRAFLVSHHRHRGGQPYLQSRAQLLHAHFHAGRRPGECVYALLSHPLGGAESCHRAQTDFSLLLGHGHHPADAETIGDHAKTRRPKRLAEGHLRFCLKLLLEVLGRRRLLWNTGDIGKETRAVRFTGPIAPRPSCVPVGAGTWRIPWASGTSYPAYSIGP